LCNDTNFTREKVAEKSLKVWADILIKASIDEIPLVAIIDGLKYLQYEQQKNVRR
jgi:hypothetical protein